MITVDGALRYYSGDFMNSKGRENLRRDNVQLSRQRGYRGAISTAATEGLGENLTACSKRADTPVAGAIDRALPSRETRDAWERAAYRYRSLSFSLCLPSEVLPFIYARAILPHIYSESRKSIRERVGPFSTTITILIFFYASRSISRHPLSLLSVDGENPHARTVAHTRPHIHDTPSLSVLHVPLLLHISNLIKSTFFFNFCLFSYTHLTIQARVFNDMTMTVIWHDTIWYDMIMRWLMWSWPWFLTMIFIFTYLLHVVWCVSVSSMRRSQTPWSSTFRKSAPHIPWNNEELLCECVPASPFDILKATLKPFQALGPKK